MRLLGSCDATPARRRWRIACAGLACVLALGSQASGLRAQGVAAPSEARHTYLVSLADAPLALDAQRRVIARRPGGASIAGTVTRAAVRQELASAASASYLRALDATRSQWLVSASQALGRTLAPTLVYRHAINGMALSLTDAEAAQLASLPQVRAITRERVSRLLTDAGPHWIGADQLWSGQVGGVAATRGEGVVIGIVDTGINPSHPSFAATGADGFHIANPRGRYLGLCATGQAACNDKLIGIYDYSSEGSAGVDHAGHGTHVAGIAAGNAMMGTLPGKTASITRAVSGVAPHANLIMYKACNAQALDANSPGECAESWLVAAIDQAIADNVDVINYSIGGDAPDPYTLLAQGNNDAAAFFAARAAGIVAVVAAGNEGPAPKTVTDPGTAPWVLTVANASHNRRFGNALTGLHGAAGNLADIAGQSLSGGYGPATVVDAGDYGNALCGTGTSEGVTPTGASNPFPPGTFHGEIVVCDRGTYARVEKGYNVKAAGAGGMVLANAASDGEATLADDHFLPAVHVGYDEGTQLKQAVAAQSPLMGSISASAAVLDNSFGDILDASSGRGPVGAGRNGLLKPDITAPGDNILSSWYVDSQFALLSGTSMASPGVAGSAALVIGAHPDWDPARVESALTGTALAGSVRRQDGITPAGPLDAGAGRVQPAQAASAGLYLPIAGSDFYAGASNPSAHGPLSSLNRSSLENDACRRSCSFTRTVADLSGGGSWTVTTSGDPGLAITVTPTSFTLAPGASQVLSISVDTRDARLQNRWVTGRILLQKDGTGSSAADVVLTAAIYAGDGSHPAFVDVTHAALAGNIRLPISGLAALPVSTYSAATLVPAQSQSLVLPNDPAPASLYTFPGTGKQVLLFPFYRQNARDGSLDLESGRVQVIEVSTPDALQVDLYAGVDFNGDGVPAANEQLCKATTSAGGPAARCVIDFNGLTSPVVWAIVEAFSDGGGTVTANVAQGQPQVYQLHDPTGPVVTGPGHVDENAAFAPRYAWQVPAPGRYFGAALIDGVPGLYGQAAMIPLAVEVDADAGLVHLR